MKKISVISILLTLSLTVGAQVQQGYIRSINRPNRQPQPIPNVTVTVGSVPNRVVVTNNQGQFSFPVTGQSYRIIRIQKQGYQLIDKGVVGRQYPFSASVRHEIVMVSQADLEADKKRIEERAYARAQADYNRHLADIQQQLQAQLITQQEAAQQELALGDNFQKFIDMIGDMAERYATMDYEGISDINRQIMQCIENAELERADSLINSKGSTVQREEELRQSREMAQAAQQLSEQAHRDYQFKLQDLAEDYYNKHTIFANHFQNDSAAYYLQRRAALDTTNGEWQNKAGDFICDYLADYNLAKNYYLRVLRQSLPQSGEQGEWTATAYLNMGSVCTYQGDYARALEYFQKALDMSKSLLSEQHPNVPQSYNNIGYVYCAQCDYAHALEYYQKALEIQKAEYGEQHPDVAVSYNNIGTVYAYQGDYARALEYYQKALEIRKAVLGEQHPQIANTYNNIGAVYANQGDYVRALEYYQKDLKISRAVLGEQHPSVASSYNNIGAVYTGEGDYTRALEYHQKALEIFKTVFGEQHPYVATSYNDIGAVYANQGDYVRALEYYQKALEISRAVLGEQHSDVATSYNNIGFVYANLGDYARALENYQTALEISRAVLGEQHPYVATSFGNIGEVHNEQGDYDQAQEYYQKALEIYKRLVLDNQETYELDVAQIQYNIGCLKILQEQYAEAISPFVEALEIYRRLAMVDSTQQQSYKMSLYYLSLLYSIQDNHDAAYRINQEWLPLFKEEYELNPETLRSDYAEQLGRQSFHAIFMRQYAEAEQLAQEGLAVDSTKHFIYSYLAVALLFQGKYAEAEAIYRQYKDELKDAFLDDFRHFFEAGVIPGERKTDVERIKAMLNK